MSEPLRVLIVDDKDEHALRRLTHSVSVTSVPNMTANRCPVCQISDSMPCRLRTRSRCARRGVQVIIYEVGARRERATRAPHAAMYRANNNRRNRVELAQPEDYA